MPSQLYDNAAVEFICGRDFVYNGEEYKQGADFPQEKALNLETMVRTRYLIPVVNSWEDKPRHWHREVRLKSEILGKLGKTGADLTNRPEQGKPEAPDDVKPGSFDLWEETEDNAAEIKRKQQEHLDNMKEQDEVPTVPGSGKQEITLVNGKEESEPVEMIGPGLKDSEDLKVEVKQVDEPKPTDFSKIETTTDQEDPGPIDIEAVGDTQGGSSSGGWNLPEREGVTAAEVEKAKPAKKTAAKKAAAKDDSKDSKKSE